MDRLLALAGVVRLEEYLGKQLVNVHGEMRLAYAIDRSDLFFMEDIFLKIRVNRTSNTSGHRLIFLGLVLFGSAATGCTDLAMENYERAFKNRQITPTEYRRAREDLDRRAEEYSHSEEAGQKK